LTRVAEGHILNNDLRIALELRIRREQIPVNRPRLLTVNRDRRVLGRLDPPRGELDD
jgi:hypothetical protein